jgi:hypothetical protein
VPHLNQGRIIRAEVFDPQGGNPKVRPLLIVSPTPELAGSDAVACVAITGDFSDPLQWDEVRLPWQRNGRGRTQLRKDCVAKCTWQVVVKISGIVDYKGVVPTAQLEQVVEVLRQIANKEFRGASGCH